MTNNNPSLNNSPPKHGEESHNTDHLLDISVVIPCAEEFHHLEKLTKQILKNNQIPREVIVICSGKASRNVIENKEKLKERYNLQAGAKKH